jgi:hypothetical protein
MPSTKSRSRIPKPQARLAERKREGESILQTSRADAQDHTACGRRAQFCAKRRDRDQSVRARYAQVIAGHRSNVSTGRRRAGCRPEKYERGSRPYRRSHQKEHTRYARSGNPRQESGPYHANNRGCGVDTDKD